MKRSLDRTADTGTRIMAGSNKPQRVNRVQRIKGGFTNNMNRLEIEPVPGQSLYRVRFKEGGDLPKQLKQYWTSRGKAQKDIDKYIIESNAKRPPK